MLTRRDVLKQAGMVAALAMTAPWWLVRRAHAARREKLIVWNQIALAPQVDRLLKEQCYAYAKQAGIKENELEYVELGSPQWRRSWSRRWRRGTRRMSPGTGAPWCRSIAPRDTSWR